MIRFIIAVITRSVHRKNSRSDRIVECGMNDDFCTIWNWRGHERTLEIKGKRECDARIQDELVLREVNPIVKQLVGLQDTNEMVPNDVASL